VTRLRHRLVTASEPGSDPACRLTPEDGRRRLADIDCLFATLAEQRQTARGNEFIFRGDPSTLWDEVTLFVDEEARCCPFFTFEQIEEPGGAILKVLNPASPVAGP